MIVFYRVYMFVVIVKSGNGVGGENGVNRCGVCDNNIVECYIYISIDLFWVG